MRANRVKKRGRFGRIVLALGALATAGLVATLVQGYSRIDIETLRIHLGLALGSTLTALFCHLWVALYLLALRREVRGHRRSLAATDFPGAAAGGEAIPTAALRWAAAALLLVLAAFGLGPAGLLGKIPGSAHAAAGYLAVAAQAASLWFERRDLEASDRLLDRLYSLESSS